METTEQQIVRLCWQRLEEIITSPTTDETTRFRACHIWTRITSRPPKKTVERRTISDAEMCEIIKRLSGLTDDDLESVRESTTTGDIAKIRATVERSRSNRATTLRAAQQKKRPKK